MAYLSGKTAIVTGAAQGLGKAFAERLAAEGANVVICDILADVLNVAADLESKGHGVLARRFDITNRGDCEALVADAATKFGSVDILVNNAALWRSTPVTDPWEKALTDFDEVMDVNLKAVMVMSRLVTPHMLKAGGGEIVNISTDYVLPLRRDGVNAADTDLYNASKWALNGLTDAAAQAPNRYSHAAGPFYARRQTGSPRNPRGSASGSGRRFHGPCRHRPTNDRPFQGRTNRREYRCLGRLPNRAWPAQALGCPHPRASRFHRSAPA